VLEVEESPAHAIARLERELQHVNEQPRIEHAMTLDWKARSHAREKQRASLAKKLHTAHSSPRHPGPSSFLVGPSGSSDLGCTGGWGPAGQAREFRRPMSPAVGSSPSTRTWLSPRHRLGQTAHVLLLEASRATGSGWAGKIHRVGNTFPWHWSSMRGSCLASACGASLGRPRPEATHPPGVWRALP
jgi:hypothetical protein